MKKPVGILIFFFIVLTFTTIRVPTLVAADALVTDLIAGRNMKVGSVSVRNDGWTLYVKYEITNTEKWCMTKTYLHVATRFEGIPQTKKGNPKPGLFNSKDPLDDNSNMCARDCTHIIKLEGYIRTLYIAAHASVMDRKTGEKEGAWAAGSDFPDGNWATYFTYTPEDLPR